jgi:hypothetical protein
LKRLVRPLLALLDYLLGFFALAVFAAWAFGRGAPTPERLITAFQWTTGLAVLELALLALRRAPVNRLILGANLWLILGGLAAFTQQWWFLRLYERWGEASLFASILVVGLATTVGTASGFVGALGERPRVLLASAALLAGVGAAFWVALAHQGNTKVAAVLPVMALSWLHRGLRHWARGQQPQPIHPPAR